MRTSGIIIDLRGELTYLLLFLVCVISFLYKYKRDVILIPDK